MPSVLTEISIAAAPQTVWAVLDDLSRYPEWNPIIPWMNGRTTLDQRLEGELVIPGLPLTPLVPTINRVVGAREFRWISEVPGEQGFTAEHIFEFEPVDGGTHVVHREIFEGPGAAMVEPALEPLFVPAYQAFNEALKARAETFANTEFALHPALDDHEGEAVAAERLICLCSEEPVTIALAGTVHHNHLCGCSRCWKPKDALFAQTALVAESVVTIAAGAEHLEIVDPDAAIVRQACRRCGAHMLGTVPDPDHHFYGSAFIHPELASSKAPKIEFAGFVSSLIEAGQGAATMFAVRRMLAQRGIASYDAFSPEIMDVIAYHRVKMANA